MLEMRSLDKMPPTWADRKNFLNSETSTAVEVRGLKQSDTIL